MTKTEKNDTLKILGIGVLVFVILYLILWGIARIAAFYLRDKII